MTDEGPSGFREALDAHLPDLAAPERRATFLGLLQDHLPQGTDAVLVGGALVEVLTEGLYVTGDLDLVGDAEQIGALLEEAGFERSGRHLLHEDHGLTVDIVAPTLDPDRETERLRWRDHTLHVLSLEDLIVDRLCAAEFWDSATDHEQATLVYEAHRDRVDGQRLRARAEEEGVGDLLDGLEAGLGDEG